MQYIIALDQGTTSSRAVLFNESGQIVDITQREFTQIFPQSGWVEHDPDEIWRTQYEVLLLLISKNQLRGKDIAAIGITNQRETTVVWNKKTGEPIMNAIVWQDKRTADICEEMKKADLAAYVKKDTGLVIDSYFSATKIAWMLRNVEGAKEMAEKGELAFGTIDTWLIWKLTKGKIHATDFSNASRTLIYNIKDLEWDTKLLSFLDIPESMLPEVLPSSHHFGDFEWDGHQIPIAGVLGDQQAALFGQACFDSGSAKNTYGTGCFVLMNTGEKMFYSKHGLITTIAWGLDGKVHYALEGSIFIAGAAVQWLRDALKIIDEASDTEFFARKAGDDDHVYMVPAFAGLGAPYWDMYARGAIFGLTRDTGKNHIVKATLQSLAYQSRDVLDAMEKDSGIIIQTLKVDGGAATNNLLMQFQSNILGVVVERPEIIESTAQGSAYMAGIHVGLWKQSDIIHNRQINKVFNPEISEAQRDILYGGWQKAVRHTMGWSKDED
jgi:glycerol kinase